jgi:ABC-type amino acid transport substrate-binding protein
MAPLPLLDLKAAEILERKVVIPPQGDPLFPALDSGLGGIAIGGISVTSEPSKRFAHSAPTMSAGR